MNNKTKSYVLHALFCVAVLGSPFMFLIRNQEVNMSVIYRQLQMPVCMLAIFYLNYLFLVPKLLLQKANVRFWMINLIVGGSLTFLLFCQDIMELQRWWEEMETKKTPRTERMAKPRKRRPDQADMRHERKPLPVVPPVWFFPFRDGMILATCVGLAVIVRTSKAFHEAEEARKEAELGRTEAELKNLRNQINPHFLLNTLNNIYALIQFDAPKAKATVHDLSQLLRFALYDNQKDYVSLSKEIEFEERYVNLMRIRVPKTADISFTHTGEIKQDLQVMPLVYISLIENAFKHGIRTNGEPCFIHIDLTVEHESIIRFCIENSNYPKDDSDRSGSGIGLEQVQKRLDLTYPGRYQWEKGVSADATTYQSHLIIETNPNKTIS